MGETIPSCYQGEIPSEETKQFLRRMKKAGFLIDCSPRGYKTLLLSLNGKNRGYINRDTISEGGVVGYSFCEFDDHRDSNHRPSDREAATTALFMKRYPSSAAISYSAMVPAVIEGTSIFF